MFQKKKESCTTLSSLVLISMLHFNEKDIVFLFFSIRNVNNVLVDNLFKMRTLVVGGTGAKKDSVRGGAAS